MADESANQFLRRRRSELIAQAAALRGQLRPIDAELAEIERMLAVATPPQTNVAAYGVLGGADYASALKPFLELEGQIQQALKSISIPQETIDQINRSFSDLIPAETQLKKALASVADFGNAAPVLTDPRSKYERMTIKELVIQSLIDHFPEGAKVGDIRKFIKEGYGRDVDQGSLRPQMHRLKADGVLEQDSVNGEIWNLIPRKRLAYAMYDHPTSRAAMKELQDEPTGARATIAGGNITPTTRLKDLK
jgi:hypothetical protein